MTTRSLVAGQLGDLERASEDVVVGDCDSAQADLLRMIEQVLGRDRAVVRPVRVEVQVDREPVAVGQRVLGLGGGRAPLARELRIDRVELGGDDVEALRLGVRSQLASRRGAGPWIADQAVHLLPDVVGASVDDCRPAAGCLE